MHDDAFFCSWPLGGEDLDAEARVLRCVGERDCQGEGPGAPGQWRIQQNFREGGVFLSGPRLETKSFLAEILYL